MSICAEGRQDSQLVCGRRTLCSSDTDVKQMTAPSSGCSLSIIPRVKDRVALSDGVDSNLPEAIVPAILHCLHVPRSGFNGVSTMEP